MGERQKHKVWFWTKRGQKVPSLFPNQYIARCFFIVQAFVTAGSRGCMAKSNAFFQFFRHSADAVAGDSQLVRDLWLDHQWRPRRQTHIRGECKRFHGEVRRKSTPFSHFRAPKFQRNMENLSINSISHSLCTQSVSVSMYLSQFHLELKFEKLTEKYAFL